MKRTALLTAILAITFLAATSIVLAQPLVPSVPNLIDFQGKLTTPAGNPVADGPHTFIFRIYDAPAGGTLLWTEGPLGISTTGGLFTHQLGSSVALPVDLFSDNNPAWLEVEAGGAIITPRTQLISNPYSRVANALEAQPPGLSLTTVRAPVPGSLCQLSTYSADATEAVRLWGCAWGEIVLFDGDPTNDVNAVLSAPSAGGFLSLSGGPSFILLNAGSAGDASALLPTDAVNAGEMLNEPGVSHDYSAGGGVLGASAAYATTSITVPTSGFMVITAQASFFLDHTVGTQELIRMWISTAPADGINFDNAALHRNNGQNPTNTGLDEFEVMNCTKVEAVGAGVHTYYLNADKFSGGPCSIARVHLTAMFFPTNYGTVVSTKPVVSRVDGNITASADATGSDQPSEIQVTTVADHNAQLEAERAKQMAEMEARIKKLEEASKQQGIVQTVDDNR